VPGISDLGITVMCRDMAGAHARQRGHTPHSGAIKLHCPILGVGARSRSKAELHGQSSNASMPSAIKYAILMPPGPTGHAAIGPAQRSHAQRSHACNCVSSQGFGLQALQCRALVCCPELQVQK
jgi:hypothetical protein